MNSTHNFEVWKGDATDEEVMKMKEAARKSFIKYLLLSFIPFVNLITLGRALFCYNTYIFIKTKGRGKGNPIIRFWLGLNILANLFIPLIGAKILENNVERGHKVLGFDKL